ncbi:IclR family transcriptional regulator domain-containing protein [Streptomyces liangshanensis]|uniref:IclR family transcriptional regulator domain-containing protein n=1 Tax=Streptomyces liangshanensis TaxID=2717324 RepID=UPI0036DDA4D2
MPEPERRDHLQTLERGLMTLLAFADREPWLTLGDLSAATGLTKPTVRRVMMTLESMGFARSDTNRYALTPRVLRLGYAYLSSIDLPRLAQPVMESLTDRLRFSASLGALDGTDVVYVNRVQPHQATVVNLAIGTRMPAHATSMGHVLLAGLSPDALAHYLADAHLAPMTHQTVTSAEELTDRLNAVRAQGWAAVDQHVEVGRRAAAAPVTDASGRVVAALALSSGTSGESFETFAGRVVPEVLSSAAEISRLLGADH